jgi:hypothetical protein
VVLKIDNHDHVSLVAVVMARTGFKALYRAQVGKADRNWCPKTNNWLDHGYCPVNLLGVASIPHSPPIDLDQWHVMAALLGSRAIAWFPILACGKSIENKGYAATCLR